MPRDIKIYINQGLPGIMFTVPDEVKKFTLLEIEDTTKLPDKSTLYTMVDSAGNELKITQEKY